ncbi:MAG TPA: hypothetical protein VMH34_00470 [Gammaproteobacteria bacterium]|nr:hypothetical protein [Gammaproteobacteria bacterium]
MSDQSPIKVIVTDFEMSFWSMVFFMVKWAIAAIPAAIILVATVMLVVGVFATFAGLR